MAVNAGLSVDVLEEKDIRDLKMGALLGEHTTHREQATAMEKTTLMSWTRTDIEAQIERQPRLGVALIQVLVARCLSHSAQVAREYFAALWTHLRPRYAHVAARVPRIWAT